MARQTRATSQSTGIRDTGADLGEVSASSRAIRRARAFATDAQLAMRAQLARMEERIEVVEAELREERRKNCTLQGVGGEERKGAGVAGTGEDHGNGSGSGTADRKRKSAPSSSRGGGKRGREESPAPAAPARSRRAAAAAATVSLAHTAVTSRRPAARREERSGEDTREAAGEESRHRCTVACPASCQGHLRPTEIVVYEGSSFRLHLLAGRLRRPASPAPRVEEVAEVAVEAVEVEAPARVRMLLAQPAVVAEEALLHTWNPADCSFNLRLRPAEPGTVVRRPVAQSTDCVRGKRSYSRGVHVWRVDWRAGERGTHAVVGVATRAAPLHSVGYRSLVGAGEESWGWDLGRSTAYHGDAGRPYPALPAPWAAPDTFHMILDMDAATLAFEAEGRYLGPAFTCLPPALFPTISTVWGNCEVSLTYRGGLGPEPLLLQQLAREEIRRTARGSVAGLGLPTRLRRFLNYQ